MTNIETLVPEVLAHAKSVAPAECCGLVHVYHGALRYVPCRNVAATPDEHFIIDPLEYARVEDRGEIVGIVHSHVGMRPEPSEADKVSAEIFGVPWLIVNPLTDAWHVHVPNGFVPPYVGREFVHGVVDCYTIIRDWYRQEVRIVIPDFERRDGWWDRGENLYRRHFGEAGFDEVLDGSKRKHDVLLMMIGSNQENHGAIYLDNGLILHHVQKRLSTRDVWGGYWKKVTTATLRHRLCQ